MNGTRQDTKNCADAPPRIVVLPGDGIGPEVTAVARRVLEAAGVQADWEEHPVGWTCWREHGDPLPAATQEACRGADAVLLGAITSKPDAEAQQELPDHLRGRVHYRSPIVRLRQELGLFANVRPARGNGLDLVLFRENTEDLYGGHEARPVPVGLAEVFPGLPAGPDCAVTLRFCTRVAVERICRAAFQHAEANGTGITLIEKANVMRATGGLVREVFHAVAAVHPGVPASELHADAALALLVREPGRFSTVVATNLFGDLFSDLAAELAGGLGLAASANLGPRHAVFEPVHGSAPDIAGQGTADPIGAVRAAAMLARHVGQGHAAQAIEAALEAVLEDGPHPPVRGGVATTREIEEALLARLRPTP